MNKTRNPQETICQIIRMLLKNDDFKNNINTPGYSGIFNEVLRQFYEIIPPCNEDAYKKTYKNIKRCKKYHKFTKRAVKVYNNHQDRDNNDKIWKKQYIKNLNRKDGLHYEHIVPIKVVKNKLIHLNNPEIDKIFNIMKKNEVIIISKQEREVLDGDKKKIYQLDGKDVCGKGLRDSGNKKDRLGAVEAEIDEWYKNNNIYKINNDQ